MADWTGTGLRRGLSRRSAVVVDDAIARAALSAERSIAAARLAFFGALLLRFFLVTDFAVPRLVLTVVPLGGGILYSLWVLLRVKLPPRGDSLWVLSVVLDACSAFLMLLSNVLWPSEGYVGILRMADTAGLLVATVAAGFRLSPRAAVVGGLCNIAGLVILVSVDRLLMGSRFEVSLPVAAVYGIFIGGMALLAVILAVTTRRLARRSAEEASRAEQAERGLGALLADSHDLSSLLSAATLDAEHLAAELADCQGKPVLGDVAGRLRDDLLHLRSVAVEVKGRALGDLTSLDECRPAHLETVVQRAMDRLRAVYPDVAISLLTPIPQGLRVLVAGGETTLERMLQNLLGNACESQARTVEIQVELDGEERARLQVVDDGPGFPPAVLAGRTATTKPGGSGVGLAVVKGLAEASGGLFCFGPREKGGASAVVTLPRVPAGQAAE